MAKNSSSTDSPISNSFIDNSFDDLSEDTNDFTTYWQSIPDPPTPVTNDVNKDENEAVIKRIETGQPNSVATISLPSSSRKQSSLPGPKRQSVVLRDVTNHDLRLSGLEEKSSASSLKSSATLKKMKTSRDDDDLILKRKTRLKKRRSFLLSSDVLVASGGIDKLQSKPHISDSAQRENSQIHRLPHCHENEIVGHLVDLVRAYCSLPMDRRKSSDEAKDIEKLSGYPIIREANAEQTRNVNIANVVANGKKKCCKSEVSPSNESIVSCKREFLMKVQPVVQAMETQKKQDSEDAQMATNCQVKRGVNGIGYCYFDTNSGKEVSAGDYKLRYSAMINERRLERRKNRNVSPSERVEEKLLNDDLQETKSRDNHHYASQHTVKRDQCGGDGDQCSSDDESNVDTENSMTFDESVIMEDESPSLEFDRFPNNDVFFNDIASKLAQNEGCYRVFNLRCKEESDSHSLLHGMSPTMDPRIISARRQLFRKIDEVLKEYSREILAIQNADFCERKVSMS